VKLFLPDLGFSIKDWQSRQSNLSPKEILP
jgi:hypothetical protein